MTDKTNELKCCPFCGGATIHRGTNALHPNNQHYRECCGCFTRIEGYASSEAADMAWNRRYAHAAELREQLKAANYLIGLVGKYYPLAEDAISFELMEYVRKYPADFTEPADNLAEVGEIVEKCVECEQINSRRRNGDWWSQCDKCTAKSIAEVGERDGV